MQNKTSQVILLSFFFIEARLESTHHNKKHQCITIMWRNDMNQENMRFVVCKKKKKRSMNLDALLDNSRNEKRKPGLDKYTE